MSSAGWTPTRATALLLERELFGMRFELDRIKALLSALGEPQRTFRAVHIVGTNGKTSTTRFAAAVLAASGLRAGAYLSPHLTGFHERVLLPGGEGVAQSSAEAFAEALGRVHEVATKVEADVLGGELVTQFELVTATALLMFAESGVEVAVIEAGLGGRWDATNVLPSPKTVVLTSVGLDHTQWLGDSVELIAAEKLAVLGQGDRLIVPEVLPAALQTQAEAAAEAVEATFEVVPTIEGETELEALGSFQAENFALAVAAARSMGVAVGLEQVEAGSRTVIPGRMMVTDESPLTILDAAHNPQGAERLAESISALADGRKVTAVIGMLKDKDSDAFLRPILPLLDALVTTAPMNPRALSASALAEKAISLGIAGGRVQVIEEARAAVIAASEISGEDGVVLVTGSIHLIGDLLSKPGERVVSSL